MSLRKDGGWVKQERMNRITIKITKDLKAGGRIKVDKLVAWIELNIGLTKDKARAYVETIALGYDYIITDGYLTIP